MSNWGCHSIQHLSLTPRQPPGKIQRLDVEHMEPPHPAPLSASVPDTCTHLTLLGSQHRFARQYYSLYLQIRKAA